EKINKNVLITGNLIRNIIIDIRKSKLPNPVSLPNVGSFFHNPIIDKNKFIKLKEIYPEMPSFNVDDFFVKIPAGWLIEKVGLKGKSFGKISVYNKNALVLVNNHTETTLSDVLFVESEIKQKVKDVFDIEL